MRLALNRRPFHWVAMPVLTNLSPFDINPDFNAARLMHRCTQPKRKRFVIGNHAHKKEGRGTRYNAAQKGTATGDCLRGCCRSATFYQTSVHVLFCFHEAAIAPAFHSRELRGELRLQAIKMAGCHVCRIQTRQPSCPGSSGLPALGAVGGFGHHHAR